MLPWSRFTMNLKRLLNNPPKKLKDQAMQTGIFGRGESLLRRCILPGYVFISKNKDGVFSAADYLMYIQRSVANFSIYNFNYGISRGKATEAVV